MVLLQASLLETAEVQRTKLERENLHLSQEMEKYSEIQVDSSTNQARVREPTPLTGDGKVL